MNVMIPFTAGAGILTYAWPFAQSKPSLIAVTVIYGRAVSSPLRDVGITHILIDFAPGYMSPFLPIPSWKWANPGTWADERGCS